MFCPACPAQLSKEWREGDTLLLDLLPFLEAVVRTQVGGRAALAHSIASIMCGSLTRTPLPHRRRCLMCGMW